MMMVDELSISNINLVKVSDDAVHLVPFEESVVHQ